MPSKKKKQSTKRKSLLPARNLAIPKYHPSPFARSLFPSPRWLLKRHKINFPKGTGGGRNFKFRGAKKSGAFASFIINGVEEHPASPQQTISLGSRFRLKVDDDGKIGLIGITDGLRIGSVKETSMMRKMLTDLLGRNVISANAEVENGLALGPARRPYLGRWLLLRIFPSVSTETAAKLGYDWSTAADKRIKEAKALLSDLSFFIENRADDNRLPSVVGSSYLALAELEVAADDDGDDAWEDVIDPQVSSAKEEERARKRRMIYDRGIATRKFEQISENPPFLPEDLNSLFVEGKLKTSYLDSLKLLHARDRAFWMLKIQQPTRLVMLHQGTIITVQWDDCRYLEPLGLEIEHFEERPYVNVPSHRAYELALTLLHAHAEESFSVALLTCKASKTRSRWGMVNLTKDFCVDKCTSNWDFDWNFSAEDLGVDGIVKRLQRAAKRGTVAEESFEEKFGRLVTLES